MDAWFALHDDRSRNLRARLIALYAVLLAGNLAAWGWAFAAFRGNPVLLGAALLAYGLGLRHAVDADHIAAIDNTTRKLLHEGKRPLGIGLFFALGHSTVVIVAAVAVAATAGTVEDRFPSLVAVGGMVGTGVSAAFLFVIAAINMVVLVGVWRLFRQARRGEGGDGTALARLLARRSLVGRLLRRLFGLVARSWHLFPIGLLFGLGFDTASEIGLLGISATEAVKGVPAAATLVFPALFTAGMTLVDTTDGVLMLGAYGWALVDPARKLYYNLAITGVSVAVAVVIGGIEALSLVAGAFGLDGGVSRAVDAASGDFGALGYAIVAILVASWLVAFVVYRVRDSGKISA